MTFTARNERVYNGEKMIASIWAEYPSKDCLPGESWMQMMERTEGAREKATQDTFDRARLFAAAPELFEALSQCFDYPADVFDHPEDRPFTMTVTGRHLQMVRTALAKATGEAA